ncbi:hypothetical protein L208DRAFT_1465881, partial [Tricholoma matsutake]
IEPEITLTVGLKTVDTHAAIDVEALLDSGATGLIINQSLMTGNGINTRKLAQPIMVYNIDGTVNHGGTIKEEVTMVLKSIRSIRSEPYSKCAILGKPI